MEYIIFVAYFRVKLSFQIPISYVFIDSLQIPQRKKEKKLKHIGRIVAFPVSYFSVPGHAIRAAAE